MATEQESELYSQLERDGPASSSQRFSEELDNASVPVDAIEELEGRRLQLRITIENLAVSRPRVLKHVVAVGLALVLS